MRPKRKYVAFPFHKQNVLDRTVGFFYFFYLFLLKVKTAIFTLKQRFLPPKWNFFAPISMFLNSQRYFLSIWQITVVDVVGRKC